MAGQRAWLGRLAGLAVFVAGAAIAGNSRADDTPRQPITLACDPTRALYAAINPLFLLSDRQASGQRWVILQSHGGSSRQAMRIRSGAQKADVATPAALRRIRAVLAGGCAEAADRLHERV